MNQLRFYGGGFSGWILLIDQHSPANLPTSQMPNWDDIRAEFPALSSFTYLDTASFGQLPTTASARMVAHLAHRDQTASSHFLSWFDDMDVIRGLCARLVHCAPSDIAFVPNASTGLAFLMNGLQWETGDEILTLSDEFPNQLYQGHSAQKTDVTFRKIAWSEFYSSINDRTRLVLLSTVNYASGFRPPLVEISRFLRERGIMLYADGTQSVGALQFDVEDVKPAVLCVDAYKWMMSPNGAGFVYIDPALRPHLTPSVVGWRSDIGWRDVNSLNHDSPRFPDAAQRYEGGMLSFPSLYAMGAVLELILDIGSEVIENRVLELAGQTRSLLSSFGAAVNSDPSQIVTARFPDRDASQLAALLRQKRILVSARHGHLRVSPHFYNNEADLEALSSALR